MATASRDFQGIGGNNVDLAMKAFGAFTKGMQTAAAEIVDYNKTTIERSTNFLQDLAGAKDVGQAVQIQANYMKTSYEGFASELTKLGEIWRDATLAVTK